MALTDYRVGDVALFITYAGSIRDGWEEAIRSTRQEHEGAYIQVVNGLSVLDAVHAAHVAFNVLQAHKFGYNKMKNVEAELIMNLACKNSFSEAIQLVGVKRDSPIAVLSFSRDEKVALDALHDAVRVLELKTVAPDSFREDAQSWLVRLHNVRGRQNIEDLRGVVIERSAIFYAKYRNRAPQANESPVSQEEH